jgi:hypothetical protein
MEARPPVIRQLWTFATILPSKDEGYSAEEDYLCLRLVGLAYLGGGRLCTSLSSPYREDKRMILALTAVELKMSTPNGELLLPSASGQSDGHRAPCPLAAAHHHIHINALAIGDTFPFHIVIIYIILLQ